MTGPARKVATYADVLAAPEHLVAEIIHGTLHLHPRPSGPHTAAASALGGELAPPFGRGRGGPGGWILLVEPELHLASEILVPDLAGWRRTRMPHVTRGPYFTVSPDWVCEVLSPSTAKVDRAEKLPIYAEQGVGHAWLVDPSCRTLEVLRLENGRWSILGAHHDEEVVRAEPFDAFALSLGVLWADVEPESK